MAGIGFELKKMLKDDSWLSIVKAYGYAGIISSGPWVLSIMGLMLISIFAVTSRESTSMVTEFLVSVTYLMSLSLVVSGLFQLLFSRFISDLFYLEQQDKALATLLGGMVFITAVSGLVGITLALLFLRHDPAYAFLMVINFVLLCNLWIVIVFVSGLKRYKEVLLGFLVGYIVLTILALVLVKFGTVGMLSAVFCGHALLVIWLMYVALKEIKSDGSIHLGFLERDKIFPILIWVGFFFNVGIWVDKWLFWFYPETSDAVNGVLRASVIYDLPIFLAYLSIIPGMAVFLLRVETDFAQACQAYYQSMNEEGTLSQIEALRHKMVASIRRAYLDIIKVQGATLLIFMLFAKDIIAWLGLSPLYAHLYYVDLIATAIQVLFLVTLNILFYLNLLSATLILTVGLFVLNAILTMITLYLGPIYYGYGFLLSLLITTLIGMYILSEKVDRLEYLTFMKQK